MTADNPSFDASLFDAAMDRLFASAEGGDTDEQRALAERPRIEVRLGADVVPGPPILVLASKADYVAEVESQLELIESLLGLPPGRSCEPIPPGDLRSAEEIHQLLEERRLEDDGLKPDQTDPLLERMPKMVRAGEVAHGIGAIPNLVRLQRLQGASLILRERGDQVIQSFIVDYMEEPSELYSLSAQRADADFRGASEMIEGWIDGGMERMAGGHGHWDRNGRWPTALLVLQSMSLGCLVRSGVRGSLRELSILQRQFYKPDYIFLAPVIDRFYRGLKAMDLYADVVACSNS